MGNIECTKVRIHRRLDFKGPLLGQSADKVETDENTALKDLDLNYLFYLEPSWRGALLKIVLFTLNRYAITAFADALDDVFIALAENSGLSAIVTFLALKH
ncbi:phosphatidylinositol 4-phosphate 5-kinase 9-like protein [Tanacetum coccineum]